MQNRYATTAKLKSNIAESGKNRIASLSLVDFSIAENANVALATICHSSVLDYTEDQIAESISKRFDGQVSLVEASLRSLPVFNGNRFATALLRQNVVSKDYDENIKNMVCVASDTFVDENDENSIWAAVGSGDTRRLMLQADDDFEGILQSRRKIKSLPELATQVEVRNGDYTMYYSPFDNEMRYGFAVHTASGLNIFDRNSEDLLAIDPLLVMESAQINDEDKKPNFSSEEVASKMPGERINLILDYYRRLYKGTSYFASLEKSIRTHRG